MKQRTLMVPLLALFIALTAVAARAGEITVAAAADLTFAFQDAAVKFHKATGDTIRLVSGSSGNFFAQIRNGAPYDLFFSADLEYPRKLEAAGLAEPDSLYEYAAGRIVIWVPSASPLALRRGLPVLLDPRVRRIAIANPQHAPYGRAAAAAMRRAGIYDQLRDKLVLGENISQAAQFAASGNADAGIIALSLALAPALESRGRFVEVPPADYPPILQAAVIVRSSRHKDAARRFIAFLKGREGMALMESYGFTPPGGAPASTHKGGE